MRFVRVRFVLGAAAAAAVGLAGCGAGASTGPGGTYEFEADPTRTLVGAGDIAVCGSNDDEATAALLDSIPGTVFTAGDNAYDSGTAQEFAECYAPSWGRHKERTRPSPGNHDYRTSAAAGYFDFFGASAGDPARGYYSYEVESWHIVALNSNIDVSAGSPQLQWLQADLASNGAECMLAYWHHPRFSSGSHGNDDHLRETWEVLYAAGVDVVVNGHDHDYERFAPQTPDGVADAARGIREFVVGTGGRSLRGFGRVRDNSEVRNAETFGVLLLHLSESEYEWRFVPVEGADFSDAGRASCSS